MGVEYIVFVDTGGEECARGCFEDVDEAKRQAQELAAAEDSEFFVFSLSEHREVARFYPDRQQRVA